MWDPDYMNYMDYLAMSGVEEEEEEEEEEDNSAAAYVDRRPVTTSRPVSNGRQRNDSATNTALSREVVDVDDDLGSENNDEEERESSNCRGEEKDSKGAGKGCPKGDDSDGENGELNRGEIDGLFCPICFEDWSSGGDHHVCCLPCGHIYGLSCIKKWLRRRGSGKCPQCKKRCGIKDIRLLYATQIVAVDGELQKNVRSLEDKCTSLEKKNADLSKKEAESKKREADLSKQVRSLKERNHKLEDLLEDADRRASGSSASCWNCQGPTFGLDGNPNFHMRGSSNKFVMQKDFQIDGARLFDIDSSSEIFVLARRLPGMGGVHVLTKVSMLYNHEKEDIRLPENTKAVKDLRASPRARLVLFASLGKKLSVLSTESNNTILTYDLPAAAWSCSWDIGSSHYVYAGLQNGTVLQFDMRQTMTHVESLTGLTSNAIHTLHSVSPNSSPSSGIRSVLTASSLGICQWSFGGSGERPYLIPDSDKQGVCISLAYCKSNDDIVASYRPKIGLSGDLEVSQPLLTAPGQGTRGSHVLFRKTNSTYQKLGATYANVCDIRLPKSAIIDGVYQNPVFASGDELTSELVVQELPSLMAIEHLKPKKHPIRDIKYVPFSSSGLLSCLSEDSLQLYTAKLL